jgi:hypothetical protein
MRRMAAEEIRDCLLQVTGELNREMGGLPALPEINMEVALQPRMIQFSLVPAHQPMKLPEQRNRRSIYTYRTRSQADPFLEVFNQPNPNESCEFRDTSSVTPQVLTLLNSDMIQDRSIAMARQLATLETSLESKLNQAISLCLGRAASSCPCGRLPTPL